MSPVLDVSVRRPGSHARGSRARSAVSSRRARGLLGFLLALGAVELSVRTGVLPSDAFPSVLEVLPVLGEQLVSPDFWKAAGETMTGWAIGLGLATALAIPLGILIGSSWILWRAARPFVEFLRPVPSIAWIPVVVLILGAGQTTKVFLVFLPCFFVLLIHAIYGVQDVDPVATDTARSFGLGAVQRLLWVTFPSASAYVATGLRIAASIALILAISIELIVGVPGLGASVNLARQGGAIELMYALIVATGLLGGALNGLIAHGERWLLHWHVSHRKAAG